MRTTRLVFMLVATVALTFWGYEAQAERRTALVIGNGAYKTTPLKNPTNDAQDMANALREMGFDVTLKLNATHRDMEEAVRAFGAKLKQGGLGLFYYAGHGVQVGGENYLIPVDTKIDAEADVKFGALNAGMALARMEDAGNDMNIIILDACRTNPFARSFRTAEQGLARMDAPKGSLIAYATAPGRVAADSGGVGRNGVYTSFLLNHMRNPGLKVEEIFKLVRADVVRATKDKQVPWESSSLIGDFYFILPEVQSAKASVVPTSEAIALSKLEEPVQQISNAPHVKSDSEADEWVNKGIIATNKGDLAEAAKCYRKAADLGDAKAQLLLGQKYAKGQGVKKNDAEAAKWYHKAAEQGHYLGQGMLGAMYEIGRGVPQNYAEAAKWYRKAAEQGYDDMEFSLARLYEQGQGVVQDDAEATKWYRKAAEQGHTEAQFRLGYAYSLGRGVPQNNVESATWYQKSADQGYARAQLGLALMYHDGKGVVKNYRESAKLLRLAAEQGNSIAQNLLGSFFNEGIGVDKNYDEAAKWYNKAAIQGNADSQQSLGIMYENGIGVKQNFSEAVKWFQKSAGQGNSIAQFNLGVMHLRGEGISKNLILAYKWFIISSSAGYEHAIKARDTIARNLTSAQIAEAQKLANQWRPQVKK